MSNNNRTQLEALMGRIQEMWGHLDTLFEGLNEADGWGQKHGTDWIFAYVPYHLATYNCLIVARSLELGPDYPEEEQELLATPEALAFCHLGRPVRNPIYFFDRKNEVEEPIGLLRNAQSGSVNASVPQSASPIESGATPPP